jgi:bacterioferritin
MGKVLFGLLTYNASDNSGDSMGEGEDSTDLINLLNKAIARELQVSIQYMLQHSIWIAKAPERPNEEISESQRKFVGTHFPFWLPGTGLKKIAITEMRHAEAIAERVVRLNGKPTTQPDPVKLGETVKEILEINKAVESGAISLYKQIIEVAEKENDEETKKLFARILSDEEGHFKTFSDMLEKQ